MPFVAMGTGFEPSIRLCAICMDIREATARQLIKIPFVERPGIKVVIRSYRFPKIQVEAEPVSGSNVNADFVSR